MNRLLREVLPALGLDEHYAAERLHLGLGNALPSSLPVNTLACGAVAAAGLSAAALRGGEQVTVEPRQVSVAFRNDQLQTIDGSRSPGFAPLSGFFETADGWVRTHGNYPHHRARLAQALGMPDSATKGEAAAVLRGLQAQDVEDRVTEAGGLAVRVRAHAEWLAGEQAAAVGTHPVLRVDRVAEAPPADAAPPPRVLDLTRVIAGPVASRTLAYLGCDVLRVDPPAMPELDAQHVDTGAGKRSTLLDLRDRGDRARFEHLLSEADVLVTGYRPQALSRFGLHPGELAERHPGLVHASLSAWTPDGPWGSRRGFDSIVQAATGIALLESADGARPGALPAQALDHAAGYLLAAGVCAALRGRREVGGTWEVGAHLARLAHWLLQTDSLAGPAEAIDDASPWQTRTSTDYGEVVQSRPAFRIDNGRAEFAWVGRRWGSDEAAWG